jgi:hypothetical protein
MAKTTHRTPLFAPYSRAIALERWREAADLVAILWHAFLDADGAPSRSAAFAFYVAALDAEEAAAADLAALEPPALAA